MAVTRKTVRWVYNGDGATKTFVYDNVIYVASDMKVFVGGAEQTTGFTVTGVGNEGGGTVVFDAAPPAGTSNVILQSEIPPLQETRLDTVSKLPSDTLETMVDRNTRLVQQTADLAGRSLRLGAGDDTPGDAMIIPDRATRANKVQGYDANGLPVAAELGDPGTLLVGSTGKALVASGSPTSARETIGAAAQTDLNALNAHTAAFLTPGLIRQRVNDDDLTPAWLPMDGRTVGSAASGADHSNDGFKDAFAALWNGVRSHVKIFDSDGIETSYGASADDDWALNKRIALLDDRGRVYIGAGQGTTPVNLTLRQLGEALGAETHLLTAAQSGVPAHTHPFSGVLNTNEFVGGSGAFAFISPAQSRNTSQNTAANAAEAHPIMQPSRGIHYEMWTGVTAGTAPLDLTSLGFTWQGAWGDSTAYVVGDVVRGSAGSYVCKLAHTGPGDGSTAPETGANWAQYWDVMVRDALPQPAASLVTRVSLANTQDIPNTTFTQPTWEVVDENTGGFAPGGTINGPTLIVPPGVSKVRLTAGIVLSDTTGGTVRNFTFSKNGFTSFKGRGMFQLNPPVSTTFSYAQIISAIVTCVPGDTFAVTYFHDQGTTLTVPVDDRMWFQAEIKG